MSSKRGGKVPRPTASNEWELRFGNRSAAKAWTELGNAKMGNALSRLYDLLVEEPRSSSHPDRHHQLHGNLATKVYERRTLDCWQHEISGSGRAWFLIDDKKQTVWIIWVGEGHPAATG